MPANTDRFLTGAALKKRFSHTCSVPVQRRIDGGGLDAVAGERAIQPRDQVHGKDSFNPAAGFRCADRHTDRRLQILQVIRKQLNLVLHASQRSTQLDQFLS